MGGKRVRIREEVMMEAEVRVMSAKKYNWLLEAGKHKGMNSPLECPEGT